MEKTIKFVYWQDGDMWLGYLEEYPDKSMMNAWIISDPCWEQ